MNKGIRTLISFGVPVVVYFVLYAIDVILTPMNIDTDIIQDIVIFPFFCGLPFFLMQLSCDVLGDVDNLFLEILHWVFYVLGCVGLLVASFLIIGFGASRAEYIYETISGANPFFISVFTAIFPASVIAMFLYKLSRDMFERDFFVLYPYMCYACGYAVALVFALLGKYVWWFFTIWGMPVLALIALVVHLILCFFVNFNFIDWLPEPDFPNLYEPSYNHSDSKPQDKPNNNSLEEPKDFFDFLDELWEDPTVIDFVTRCETDYLKWRQNIPGENRRCRIIGDFKNKKIILKNLVLIVDRSISDDEFQTFFKRKSEELCEDYIIKELERKNQDPEEWDIEVSIYEIVHGFCK